VAARLKRRMADALCGRRRDCGARSMTAHDLTLFVPISIPAARDALVVMSATSRPRRRTRLWQLLSSGLRP